MAWSMTINAITAKPAARHLLPGVLNADIYRYLKKTSRGRGVFFPRPGRYR